MTRNSHRLMLIATACFAALRVPSLCHAQVDPRDAAANVEVISEWRTFTTKDGLPANGIRALRAAADRLWVGTDRGLASSDGSTWQTWTEADGQPMPAVYAIDVDEAKEEVWFGTWGGGLYRLSGGRLDAFTQYDSGLAGDLIFSVLIDGRHVWAATNGGVSRFDRIDGAWDLYFARRADEPVPVITKFVKAGDNLFACAWREGVYRFDAEPDAWSRVKLPATVPGREQESRAAGLSLRERPDAGSAATLASSGSTLWWITQDAVSIHPRAAGFSLRERPDSTAPRLEQGYVIDAAVGDGPTLWLATHRGLEVLVDPAKQTWVGYAGSEAEHGGPVHLLWPGGAPATRYASSSLPDDDVRCVAFFQDRVWVGTAGGLAGSVRWQPWRELPEVPENEDDQPTDPDDNGLAPAAGAAAESKDHVARTESLAIAVLGPRNPTIALPGREPRRNPGRGSPDLLALQLAVNRANARGGHAGRALFGLVTSPPGYTRYGWGLPEDDFAMFASQQSVVGVVGRVEADDRITEAVALWSGLPLVNVDPAPAADRTGENPWVFRCYGDAPRHHRRMMDHLFDTLGLKRVAAIRTPGAAAALHLDWWASHAEARGRPLVAMVDYDPLADDLDSVLEALRIARADAVLTGCDAALAAKIVRRMRAQGMNQTFVGGPEIVDARFAALVDPAAGPVLALADTAGFSKTSLDADFARAYAERHLVGGKPTPPTIDGYLSFEAADHLLAAVDRAGPDRAGPAPDRAAVREALRTMSRSAAGETHFEKRHATGTTTLARLTADGWTMQTID